MKRFRVLFFSLLISLFVSAASAALTPVAADTPPAEPTFNQVYLPLALRQADSASQDRAARVTLESFVDSVVNGQADVVVGVYVDDEFAFRVVQQPEGDPDYISAQDEEVTQYDLASYFGVTGLIAHNHLAGGQFFDLDLGELVQVIYGDGSLATYRIEEISRFQALEPASFTSSFVDLDTGETFTASQLFARYYIGDEHVTFQTCINVDNVPNWGRIFILATPQ